MLGAQAPQTRYPSLAPETKTSLLFSVAFVFFYFSQILSTKLSLKSRNLIYTFTKIYGNIDEDDTLERCYFGLDTIPDADAGSLFRFR